MPSRKRLRRFGELADAGLVLVPDLDGHLRDPHGLGQCRDHKGCEPGPKDACAAASTLGWRGRVDIRANRSRCSVSGAPPLWPRRVDGQLAFAVAHIQGISSSMRACGQPWTKRVSRSAK